MSEFSKRYGGRPEKPPHRSEEDRIAFHTREEEKWGVDVAAEKARQIGRTLMVMSPWTGEHMPYELYAAHSEQMMTAPAAPKESQEPPVRKLGVLAEVFAVAA